jgi:hypothetical protein
LTHLLIERMAAGGYQFCIVDPEGDYDALEHVIHLGLLAGTKEGRLRMRSRKCAADGAPALMM